MQLQGCSVTLNKFSFSFLQRMNVLFLCQKVIGFECSYLRFVVWWYRSLYCYNVIQHVFRVYWKALSDWNLKGGHCMNSWGVSPLCWIFHEALTAVAVLEGPMRPDWKPISQAQTSLDTLTRLCWNQKHQRCNPTKPFLVANSSAIYLSNMKPCPLSWGQWKNWVHSSLKCFTPFALSIWITGSNKPIINIIIQLCQMIGLSSQLVVALLFTT